MCVCVCVCVCVCGVCVCVCGVCVCVVCVCVCVCVCMSIGNRTQYYIPYLFAPDAGKGKPSEKSTREIAAALQQRYPSRSHRSSSDSHIAKSTASGGTWSSQQQPALHVAAPESHSQIIMGSYIPNYPYSQIETSEVDPIVGILAAPSEPQPTNVHVIQGPSHEQMQGNQRTQTVLIPMAGHPGNVGVPQQDSHAQHTSVSGSFTHPPATLYSMQQPPHHTSEGYMVPVIAASHSQMPVHTIGSVVQPQPPQGHYRSPGNRGQP